MRLDEKVLLAHQTLLDESSGSTPTLTKRRCDMRTQLSDAMQARLGPQIPGMEWRPDVAKAQEVCPDPSAAAAMPKWPLHASTPQWVGALTDRGLPGSVSRQLDDMLSMPFNLYIINYEPPRGFMVPKFTTFNGTSDLFDHIMHYRQLMTLDIGNDTLLYKVFPANLHVQALSWFHCLPKNFVNNFRIC